MKKTLLSVVLLLTMLVSMMAPIGVSAETADLKSFLESNGIGAIISASKLDEVVVPANIQLRRTGVADYGDAEGSFCNRFGFHYVPKAGLGHFIHTYVCDGNPIPTFQGEPERICIPNDIDEYTSEIWNALDENNRISLYVRFIDLSTGKHTNRLINKNV